MSRKFLPRAAWAVLALALVFSITGSATAKEMRWEVYFDLDKDDLKPAAQAALVQIAQLLRENPGSVVTAVGHTCDLASEDYNQDLSKRRASTVAKYLAEHAQVESERVRAGHMGTTKPKYPNDTPIGKARNRRVEIIMELPESAAPNVSAPASAPADVILSSFAVVVDDNGNFIRDLPANNFRVSQGGVEREVVRVSFEEEVYPSNVSLVLDKSASMSTSAIADLKEAAKAFCVNKKQGDKILVVSFSSEIEAATDFTDNPVELYNAIEGIRPHGFTRLYDALQQTSAAMVKVPGPRVMILMTDGVDERGLNKKASRATLDEAIKTAKAAGVTVFTIGLGKKINSDVLKKIARETGGVYYQAGTSSQLQDIYRRLSIGTLRGKYRIDFRTSENVKDPAVIQSGYGRVIGIR